MKASNVHMQTHVPRNVSCAQSYKHRLITTSSAT